MFSTMKRVEWNQLLCALFLNLFLVSCWQKDPSGSYQGEIKDWVYEVYEAPLITQGNECEIEIILKQAPEGFVSQLIFQHPKMEKVTRSGKWKVEDGYRSVFFEDGKSPAEYFLVKSGARFAFQTKEGLSNDDGSPILLMRNEGKSRKASYPFKIEFLKDNLVQIETSQDDHAYTGTWKWGGDQISVSVAMGEEKKEMGNKPAETYKYFFTWEEEGGDNLYLEKMLITRPFLNEDGTRRQSWMSSLVFSDRPILKPR
ncbi:MAG: hypothetical protein P8P49_12515 [Opitutales bacterium]|nr:hypothetical protein [Opitutales bacterium]MDG1326581.1 hypothetical protein [Opitutales bacterium]